MEGSLWWFVGWKLGWFVPSGETETWGDEETSDICTTLPRLPGLSRAAVCHTHTRGVRQEGRIETDGRGNVRLTGTSPAPSRATCRRLCCCFNVDGAQSSSESWVVGTSTVRRRCPKLGLLQWTHTGPSCHSQQSRGPSQRCPAGMRCGRGSVSLGQRGADLAPAARAPPTAPAWPVPVRPTVH